MKKEKTHLRDPSKYSTGFSDNFVPLEPLDLSKVKNFDEMARAMSKTSFGARNLGEAADVLYEMVSDKDCFVVGTFSGAMTVAKMGLLICDMIDKGMLDAIVATGALMGHGFIESIGNRHFKYNYDMNDTVLFDKGFDRIHDTLELERNFESMEKTIFKIIEKIDNNEVLCSYKITNLMGKYLSENFKGRAILKSAYEKKVPVYIPAFTDSVLAFYFSIYRRLQMLRNEKPLQFNPFLDLENFAEKVNISKKTGIFTIGGGVPRNWGQQAATYLEYANTKLFNKKGYKRFDYAVRICPEPVHWGGLSGCTYSEGISWGKFVPPSEGGRFAEVFSDATIAWPIILKAVMERLDKEIKIERYPSKTKIYQ